MSPSIDSQIQPIHGVRFTAGLRRISRADRVQEAYIVIARRQGAQLRAQHHFVGCSMIFSDTIAERASELAGGRSMRPEGGARVTDITLSEDGARSRANEDREFSSNGHPDIRLESMAPPHTLRKARLERMQFHAKA